MVTTKRNQRFFWSWRRWSEEVEQQKDILEEIEQMRKPYVKRFPKKEKEVEKHKEILEGIDGKNNSNMKKFQDKEIYIDHRLWL